jgi:hypothetical protein
VPVTDATVPATGATVPVAAEAAGATVPAAGTGDVVLVEVAAFVAVAGVSVAADGLSAPAAGARAPVVVPASEVVAWVTVTTGALPEVAVDWAGLGGTAGAPEVACEAVEETGDVTEPTVEETGDVTELTVEVTGDVTELTVEVTGDVTELAVEVTGDVTELATEVTGERGDAGDVSEVAACACRENRSISTKIPAATIASCTARKAMRRTIGCGITSSHSPETGRGTRARYRGFSHAHPGQAKLARKLDMLFGHHRTAPWRDQARRIAPFTECSRDAVLRR